MMLSFHIQYEFKPLINYNFAIHTILFSWAHPRQLLVKMKYNSIFELFIRMTGNGGRINHIYLI